MSDDKVNLEALMDKFKEITGNSGKGRRDDDPKKYRRTVDELKAIMEQETISHADAKALLVHMLKHMDLENAGFCAAYMHENEGGESYACGGGVRGNPALCALGTMTILKGVLEKC